jgi:hypothetical protein
VFLFYVQLLSKTFLILRRIYPEIIKNVKSFCVKHQLFLSDFHEILIFLKVLNIKFHENRQSGAELFQMDRHMDGYDEANSCFLQFCERA